MTITARPVSRLFLASLVLVGLMTAGCDSGEEAIRPVFSDLIVTLTGPDELGIETEEEYGTPFPIRVDRESTPTGLRLRVVGVEPGARDGIQPQPTGYGTATVRLGLREGEYAVELVHLGATDVYRLVLTSRAHGLTPVRTSVSRLGPRDRPF